MVLFCQRCQLHGESELLLMTAWLSCLSADDYVSISLMLGLSPMDSALECCLRGLTVSSPEAVLHILYNHHVFHVSLPCCYMAPELCSTG